MRGYNRVIIAGNLTRDPDVRYTVNKNAYARFTVAINRTWKNQNGEMQDATEYINVLAWSNNAENCGKYLKKGSAVLVEGRLQTSSYEAKDGSGKRYSTDVVAEIVHFLGSGQQSSGDSNYPRQSSQSSSSGQDWNNDNKGNNFGEPPSDESFGKNIGESGFGGFSSDFGDNSEDNSDIPF